LAHLIPLCAFEKTVFFGDRGERMITVRQQELGDFVLRLQYGATIAERAMHSSSKLWVFPFEIP
jgi:hypothetical protein